MPEYIWTLVAILLVEAALYILQKMVINAAKDKREERLFIARQHVTDLLRAIGDIEYYDARHKKRKTTSEKDEDLNGPDDPDINDFLD